MKLAGNFTVAAPREQVFQFLQDPQALARCLPGCKQVQQTGPDRYSALVEVSVAFMRVSFQLEARIAEATAPSHLVADVTGQPLAVAGQLKMSTSLHLTAPAPAETAVAYTMDVHLTGRLGSLGESVLRPQAQKMGDQFAKNVQSALTAPPA